MVSAAVGLMMILWTVGCGGVEIESSWKDREIVVDGYSDDWLNTLYYFEEDNFSAGFFNDNDHLYACLLVEDYFIQSQVVRQGFTLWFDSSGGKEKRLGIRFPIGMQAMRGERKSMDEGDMPVGPERVRPDPEKIREAFERTLGELEILGPGEDNRQRIPVERAKGLSVNARYETGLLIYELKVPLHSDDPDVIALGSSAGALLGVGMEVPKMDLNKMKNMRGRMGGRPGGMPPGGGRPGGRPGGIGGSRGMDMLGGVRGIPDGLKIWAKLHLAFQPE